MIFKMAAVRHVGFIVTSSYCTGRLEFNALDIVLNFDVHGLLQLSCFTILA